MSATSMDAEQPTRSLFPEEHEVIELVSGETSAKPKHFLDIASKEEAMEYAKVNNVDFSVQVGTSTIQFEF